MPKLPTVEFFEVTVQCPKDVLGELVADLNKRNLTHVNFNLVSATKTFTKNAKPEVASQDLLAEWIKEHPTFKAIEAVKYFEEQGRTKGSTYPALGILVEKGVLKKLGPGDYARADVKALAPPKKKRVAKGPPKTFDKRGEDVVLSYAKRNHGRFNTPKLVEIFQREGRAKNSVYASIDALMKQKLVKRVGEKGGGQYVLLNKATASPKAKPKKPPAQKLNGEAPAPVEVELPAGV
jgi:Fe2+ or Zn2+ uptake regulation protein